MTQNVSHYFGQGPGTKGGHHALLLLIITHNLFYFLGSWSMNYFVDFNVGSSNKSWQMRIQQLHCHNFSLFSLSNYSLPSGCLTKDNADKTRIKKYGKITNVCKFNAGEN
jgi:hypothetical protein